MVNRGVGENAASWYDYDGDQDRFRTELFRTESLLLDVMGRVEAERALKPSRRVLLGFSQGGYCGAYLALRHPELFGGLIVSGARVKTEFLADEMREAAATGRGIPPSPGRPLPVVGTPWPPPEWASSSARSPPGIRSESGRSSPSGSG